MPEPVKKILLSTVTPLYKGEDFVRELVARLHVVKTRLEKEDCPVLLTEAIFVDDGAVDGSCAVLAELEKEHSWLRVVHLSRNFGQHPATIAGILHSCGEWVATLDEDLQHPPERLFELLSHAVTRGRDVVYANPAGEVHHARFRNLTSRWYKIILSKLSGNPHVRHFNSFRMVRGTVARGAAALAGSETYLDVALCWFTTRVGSVTLPLVDIRTSAGKKSGYNLWALLRHARRMLTTSQIKLLRIGGLIGFIAVLASLGWIAFIVVWKLMFPESVDIRGWASTVVCVIFFGGLGAFLHGIAIEYLSLIVQQTQGRPVFLVVDRDRDRILLDWLKNHGAN